MKTKDEIIEWLRDAHAMEKAMEVALKKQADSSSASALMREQAGFHLAETKHHAELVETCLKKHGAEVSTLKTTVARGLEMMKGVSLALAGDHRVKDVLSLCAAEHFEIACYRALRTGAERTGLFDIVEMCDRILKDEQRMAEWLDGNLPHVIMSYLEDDTASPASLDAEDDDMPDMEPRSDFAGPGVRAAQGHPFDIDEGREIIPGSGSSQAEAVGEPPAVRVHDEQTEFVLPPSMQGSTLSATADDEEGGPHTVKDREAAVLQSR